MAHAVSIAQSLARRARELPSGCAVADATGSVPWSELDRLANRVARALAAQGVGFGEMVTLAVSNTVASIAAVYACWKIGCVPQPISPRAPQAELDRVADLAQSRLVVGEPCVETALPRHSVRELAASVADDSPLPDVISPSWKAQTSGGSTGTPKLIVSGVPATLEFANPEFWRADANDVAVIPGPLFHSGPFVGAFCALTFGARSSCFRSSIPRQCSQPSLRSRRLGCTSFRP